MLRSSIVRLVELCTRHAWPVIVLAIALAAFCTLYTARHFAVATDIKQLFPTELPWTQRAYDFIGTFPQHDVLVIVDAPTAESADRAAAKLTAALSADTAHFKAVQQPQGDRKSTRLNSSHVSISYAVFCLKKKKKQNKKNNRTLDKKRNITALGAVYNSTTRCEISEQGFRMNTISTLIFYVHFVSSSRTLV